MFAALSCTTAITLFLITKSAATLKFFFQMNYHSLDISQAYDKVWHEGLCFKLKKAPAFLLSVPTIIPTQQALIHWIPGRVVLPIKAGVPQGSILGSVLYLLFTADLPTNRNTVVATFTDHTAILASHEDPLLASTSLQNHVDAIQSWLNYWRVKANESKLTHVTFTLKKDSCPHPYYWMAVICRRRKSQNTSGCISAED